LTFKYTDDFEKSKKNYPETEIDQFILTIDSIISGNLDKKTINEAVWDKYQEIRNLASNGKIEFKVFVVSNKLPPVAHAKLKLENAISKYRIVEKPVYIDQEKLVSIILENKSEAVNGSIRFIDKQYFEKSDGSIKTVIGAVAASDLINLIKLDNENINENIFNENVRVYKPKHRVNEAIIETASSENNYQFFYLNNGITILCENVEYAPNTRSPIVELANFQIINGGQTSHSLFEVFKKTPDKIDSLEVMIRICEAKKDNPINERISETSNNQIPVGSRDLHSNDLIQRKLEDEFETLGYYFERKPNKYSDKPQDKVLNNELLGQLYMSYHLDMPSEAKNNKQKVFADFYDEIFDSMVVNAKELLRLYQLYLPLLIEKKNIQKKKRKKEFIDEKEAFVSRATFHILNGTKYFFKHAVDVIEKQDIPEKEKERKKVELYSEKGEEFRAGVINIIYDVVLEQMKLRGDLYSHDKFFKESNTNHILKDRLMEKVKEVKL